MARLPSAVDLQRRPAPANSPNINAPRIDYGPASQAAGQIGQAIGTVGKAVSVFGEAQQKDEAHDLDRRMLDFKLDTEMALEEHKRAMPAGGTGFASSWLETYKERASAFVGENYGNIPQRHRSLIENKLVQQEVMLQERAQREEFAERDRKTVEDLTLTLGKTRSVVEASPDRLEEMATEGEGLINSASLPPELKSSYLKKYRTELEESAAVSIADRVTNRDSYDRAKEILAPHKAERVTSTGVARSISPPGQFKIYDRDTPSIEERRSVRASGGVVVNLDTNWAKGDRPTAPMVVIPDDATPEQRKAAEAYATRIAEVYEQKFGVALKPHVKTRSENGRGRPDTIHTEPFSVNDTKAVDFFSGNEGRAVHAQILRETFGSLPGVAFSLPHDQTRKGDSGAVGPRGSEVDLAKPLLAELRGGSGGDGLVEQPQQVGEDGKPIVEEAYEGPFRNLSLAKRRAIWGKAEAQFDKVRKGVETVIKEQSKVAGDGYLPPEPILNEIQRQVRDLGDPALAAQYDTMLRRAEWTQKLQRAPAGAIEEQARKMKEVARQGGATKEFLDEIQHVEKLAESVAKQVNENPLKWAESSQIMVPVRSPDAAPGSFRAAQEVTMAPVVLDRLNFAGPDINTQLARRMDQAKQVGGYYGQPPKVFTKNETDFLKDVLRQGGPPMLGILGMVARSAADAGIEPSDVMKEFATDAPEVAVIGEAVASNADPRVLDTAANALSWRAKQGEKFVSTIDKAQAKPDLAEYADVLSATPLKADAVRHTANLLYEYEARRQGKETFDPELYRTTVRRIMGETEMPDGTRYGGVAEQGTGWSDGKWKSGGWMGTTPKVLVPPEIRQDSFDEMTAAIRAKDLEANPPMDAAGKPLPIGQVRSASWISIGPGRYALELKRDSDGTRVVAMGAGGQPYVLDVRPLLPSIARRKPEIFRGWDGVKRGVMEPE